jgi:hypothetical protein
LRSPTELLESYDEGARKFANYAELAVANGNAALAMQNWSVAVGNRFFRALLAWRTGLADARTDLELTVEASRAAITFAGSTDLGPLSNMFDAVPGAYAGLILGNADGVVLEELVRYVARPLPRNLPPDRPLEAWLVRALSGSDPQEGRDIALSLKKQKRLNLLADSFGIYFDLAAVDPSDSLRAQTQTRSALELYRRRRSDSFFIGGVQYQGGDDYNDLVIDFHIATTWRVRGWDPSGLTDEERRQVVLPL